MDQHASNLNGVWNYAVDSWQRSILLLDTLRERGDNYVDVSGSSFRDFFAGKNPALPGERPMLSDWANHLSTIFPEVRLKRYLEMRGADGVPWGRLPALPAFWVGLLYDDTSLDAAWDIVKHWNAQERQALRDDVPHLGFKARIRDRYLFEIAKECVALAHAGLRRRGHIDHLGQIGRASWRERV